MKTFEHFPEDVLCPICGTNDDIECFLMPIDGTQEGNICQAQPVHLDCMTRYFWKFRMADRKDIIYMFVEGI